jgi:hypothetical protein
MAEGLFVVDIFLIAYRDGVCKVSPSFLDGIFRERSFENSSAVEALYCMCNCCTTFVTRI